MPTSMSNCLWKNSSAVYPLLTLNSHISSGCRHLDSPPFLIEFFLRNLYIFIPLAWCMYVRVEKRFGLFIPLGRSFWRHDYSFLIFNRNTDSKANSLCGKFNSFKNICLCFWFPSSYPSSVLLSLNRPILCWWFYYSKMLSVYSY